MRQIIKQLLIPPLASRPVSRLGRRLFGHGVPIFLLHRVALQPQNQGCIAASHLERCLQYLRDHDYRLLSLQQLVAAMLEEQPLPEKTVVFTMDDGFADQAEIAAPIFLKYDCPLTFFIISGLLDGQLWPWDTKVSWIINNTRQPSLQIDFEDEQLLLPLGDDHLRQQARERLRNYFKEVPAEQLPGLLQQLAQRAGVELTETPPLQHRPMSWQQARELEQQGVQFAPHSVSHRILARMDTASVRREIETSWSRLQEELRQPVNIFCYPTGRILDFGPREIGLLQERGFQAAVSTLPRQLDFGKPGPRLRFSLPRIELPATLPDFIQYCSWIEHARASFGLARDRRGYPT